MSDIKERFIMNMNLDIELYFEMMGEVMENLKNEIKELTFKVQKAREEGNWGTYKNLIIAYKEVVQLYKEIVDKISEDDNISGTQYLKNNMTISLDENTTELINKAFIRKEVAIDNKKDMYIDVARANDSRNATIASVYCNGRVERIRGRTLKDIVDIIENYIVEDKNIYLDICGIGKGIADEFDSRNIKYKKLKINKIQN